MRFKLHSSLAVVAALCVAVAAMAQQPGQPGQQGGRGRGGPPGGFGGFGGGGGMFGSSRMSLLRIPDIRKELELADEQVSAIEKLDEELRAKYPTMGGRGGPGGPGGGPGGDRGRRGGNNNDKGALQTAPTEFFFVQQNQQPGQPGGGRGRGGPQMTPEQIAEMEKQRAERDKEANAKLGEILLPHQIKRLNEIYVQQAGTSALLDDEVAKQLGISDAQKAQVAQVREANQEAMRTQGREAFTGLDEDARRAKFAEMRKANDEKVLAVLNADQRKKFEALKGKEFAMPEFGGRGGPGGGRGGPGGTRGGQKGGNNN